MNVKDYHIQIVWST